MSLEVHTPPQAHDEPPRSVPFSRSRALQILSAGVLGLALQVAAPRLARATHNPTPANCYGLRECDCCSGSTCCWGVDCDGVVVGCPSGLQCWYTCDCSGNYWQCCDWLKQAEQIYCLCRGFVGSCPTC